MAMLTKTLYAKDSIGNIREWTITANDDYELIITHGVHRGEMMQHVEAVFENKSGRNLDDQILLQFNSRVAKKLDAGYVADIEEARNKPRANLIGLPRPMFAKTIEKVDDIDYLDAFVQRKYDGHRCLIANINDELIAYSRRGKVIRSISHILRGVDMPVGTILDGELYSHGAKLQTISSWVKREQPNTLKVRYHVYDLLSDRKYSDRLRMLTDIDLGDNANLVETYQCNSRQSAIGLTADFRSEGYEGGMLRWGNRGYESGKRSNCLLKIKEWMDAEFVIEDITPSKDGWGILHMSTDEGIPFKATAPGSVFDKIEVYENKEKYINRLVTIEYIGLTEDGVPFPCIAKAWR